ncbi:MAG: thioredoxin family protein [Odoribacter sp.]
MRYNILFTLFLCIAGESLTFGQGISFFNGTQEEAFLKAKEENKLVFMDFYADWCVPCKEMAKIVFTDSLVGEYLNAKFICMKVNTEKAENKSIVKKYKVSAMPTLVFANFEGKAIAVKVGAMEVEEFLKEAKIAAGDEMSFNDLFDQLKYSPNDLALMQKVLQEAPSFVGAQEGLDAEKWIVRVEKVYKSYIDKKMGAELINKADFRIIRAFHQFGTPGDKLAEFMNANLEAFMTNVGRSTAAVLIEHNNKIIEDFARAGKEEYHKYLDRIKGDMKLAYSIMPERNMSAYDRSKCYYDAEYCVYSQKDAAKYVELMNSYLKAMGDDVSAVDYGGAAQTMYNATEGKIPTELHQQATVWLIKALQFKDIAPMNKVNLLVMLGDSFKAMKEYNKSKEYYNQGYMESLQIEEGYTKMSMQMTIKRKLSALELLE